MDAGFNSVAEHLDAVRLRAALIEAMRLAGEVNFYLDQTGPWFEIKTDRDAAAKTIYTALRAIDSLKVLLAPFLPFTCERLHSYLGYTRPLFGTQYVESVSDPLGVHDVLRYHPNDASETWQPSQLVPGQTLQQPAPLFRKLEAEIIDQERSRLGKEFKFRRLRM